MLMTEAQTNNDDCPRDCDGKPLAVGDYVRTASVYKAVRRIIECSDIWGINQWVLTLKGGPLFANGVNGINSLTRCDANQCQKLSDEEAMLYIFEQ